MTKKTSLKDIAQAVGVSTTLVSYVLNNQKENRISKAIAQKIRKAAQDLNYQPNQIAKSLKTSKTRTIGLVVADIANPFSFSLARMIEDEADKHNYTVIFASSDESAQKSQKLINTLLNRQVDGLLIAAPEGMEDQIAELQRRQTPFVLIDRYYPHLKTNFVALDNYQSLYMAVEHLIQKGYQRIGMITLRTSLFHMNERVRGYRAALLANGISFKKRWLTEVSSQNMAADIAKAIRTYTSPQQAVEAIIFASNALTMNGLKQIKAQQIGVPEQVALVGFDEAEAYELFSTPLTFIRQPLQEMGQLVTRMLLETLTTPKLITQANLEATLVVQASTQGR